MTPEELASRFQSERINRLQLMSQMVGAVREGVTSAAPMRSGELRDSIEGQTAPDEGKVLVSAAHARHVYYGTAPHEIRPRSAKALRFADSSGVIHFAKAVRHPGTQPRPFLDEGLEMALPEVEAILQDTGENYVLALSR